VSDEVEVIEATEAKKGFSLVVMAIATVLSLAIGFGAGAFTGQPVLALVGLGPEEGADSAVTGSAGTDSAEGVAAAEEPPLFEPMPGVFDADKQRFYAEVGELLVALQHRGATRHLQIEVQLVGHDQKYMKAVENDVPAIRNGLLIFLNQQDFAEVSTYEGREALRRATLQRINEIIGATPEARIADVYFTAFITQ